MQIEINEPGREAFYKETVNAAAQYRYLLKNRNYKLKDYFKQFRMLMIASFAVLAVNILLIILWGAETLRVATSAALLVAAVMCAAYLFSLRKMYKTLMTAPSSRVLTLDENGVELQVIDAQTVRIDWNNVVAVRLFTESICFIPAGGSGIIIAVDISYAAEITEWISTHCPETVIA